MPKKVKARKPARKKPAQRPAPKSGQPFAVPRPDHISYSQIEQGRCLFRYLLTRVTGKVQEENEAMRVGSVVHAVLESYVEGCRKHQTESDHELMSTVIDREFTAAALPERRYTEIREALLEFAEREMGVGRIKAVEQEFRVDIGDGVIMAGRIDRVNVYKEGGSVLEVVDYKHTQRMLTEAEVADDLQLRLYRFVATRYLHPGYDRVRTGIYHTRYNVLRWSGPPKPVMEYAHDDDNLANFLRRQWDRLIKTPDALCKVEEGPQCWEYGGCPVQKKHRCPLYTDVAVKAKAKSRKLEERVRSARALRKRLDAQVEELKSAFEAREAIVVDGAPAGYYLAKGRTWPMVRVWPLAVDRGLKLDHITLSEQEIKTAVGGKKAMETRADIGDILALGEETATTRFEY